MKFQKLNTVPNGRVIVCIMIFLIVLIFLLAISLYPEIEAIGLLVFSLFFIAGLVHYLKNKHWNLIEISEKGVFHKDIGYSWEDVCLTVNCRKPNFLRNSYEYYVFFDEHFLTDTEVVSELIKRKGFYLILTQERAKLILSAYKKEVRILNESPPRFNMDITNKLKQHNKNSSTYWLV